MIDNTYKVVYDTDTYIVYSPLRSAAFMANQRAMEEIVSHMTSSKVMPVSEKSLQAISWLEAKPVIDTLKWFPNISRFCDLVILPNFKCNFHCSYCYSAMGRSNKEITYESIKSAIDYCIEKAQEIKRKYIRITFLGGGEPLLSWELVQQCMKYIKNRSNECHIKIKIGITTNGSLITSTIIDILKSYNCSVNISFDILPEIQNQQRGQFKKVHTNILLLNNKGISPSLRSTITKQNVHLMEQMVEFVHSHYPHVRKLHFEPVTDEETTISFYNDFISNFFQAKHKCHQYEIELICSISKSFENMRMRFCSGELCLTPNAHFTICHRASSPNESLYESSEYGWIENGKVKLDMDKASQLISQTSILNPRCQNCFARWHCGGGCYFQQEMFTEKQKISYCHFVRSFIKLLLFEFINGKPYNAPNQLIKKEMQTQFFDDCIG